MGFGISLAAYLFKVSGSVGSGASIRITAAESVPGLALQALFSLEDHCNPISCTRDTATNGTTERKIQTLLAF